MHLVAIIVRTQWTCLPQRIVNFVTEISLLQIATKLFSPKMLIPAPALIFFMIVEIV